jgi:hypothetical protein
MSHVVFYLDICFFNLENRLLFYNAIEAISVLCGAFLL